MPIRTYPRGEDLNGLIRRELERVFEVFRLLLPIRTYVASFWGKRGFTGAHPCRPIRSYGKGIGCMNLGDHLVDLVGARKNVAAAVGLP